MQKEVAKKLASLFFPLNQGRILEVGCGSGFLTEWIQRTYPKHSYLGVDLSPGMIAYCKGRYQGAFAVADIETFSFELPISAIFSSMTLQWLENPDAFIARALEKAPLFYAYPTKLSFSSPLEIATNPLPAKELTPGADSYLWTDRYSSKWEYLLAYKKMGVHAGKHSASLSYLRKLKKESQNLQEPFYVTTEIAYGVLER